MDKRILNKAELLQVQQFICSRSARFAEPAILMEITDHFASKTEELLEADPSLSFEAAMKQAHHSFGIKGFAPIAEAYEQSVVSRYKSWSRAETFRLLRSIHLAGIGLAGFLAAYIFLLLQQAGFAPFNGFEISLCLQLLYACYIHPKRVLHRKDVSFRFFHAKALEANVMTMAWIWISIFIIPSATYATTFATAVMIGIMTVITGFNLLIFKGLMKKVTSDSLELKQKVELTQ